MKAARMKTDINELSAKILQGMSKAIREMVENSAAKNENLIIGDKDGRFRSVPAKQIKEALQK